MTLIVVVRPVLSLTGSVGSGELVNLMDSSAAAGEDESREKELMGVARVWRGWNGSQRPVRRGSVARRLVRVRVWSLQRGGGQ